MTGSKVEDLFVVCSVLSTMLQDKSLFNLLKQKNTESVLSFMKKYIELFGIPAQIYTDFHTIYYNQAEHFTQYERALKTLNIEPIYAHSPQAKGRVERGNQTHQDRLVKSLRIRNISSIQDANKYLLEEYIAHHNQRFALTDSLQNIHRPSDGIGLDAIFRFETKRNVYNDYTIMRNSQYIQLYKSDAPFPPPKSKIIVRRYLDNSLHILWNNNELKYEIFNNKPKQNIVYNSLVKRLLIIRGENLTGDSLVIIIMLL
jgi:hypothetical protein